MLRRLFVVLVLAAVAGVFLVTTDQRLLLWQTKVIPGETYEVAGYGDLGKSRQPSLVCRYFTGLGIETTVEAYAPGGPPAGDFCAFLVKRG